MNAQIYVAAIFLGSNQRFLVDILADIGKKSYICKWF